MRLRLVASASFGLATCLGLGASVDACGGTAAVEVADGGPSLPEAGDAQVVDAAPDVTAPPLPGAPLTVFGAYAVKRVFLGETDRTGGPKKDAWKDYGENIDGLTTTKTSTDVCKRVGGADSAKQEDGIGGIDNAFGRTVLGFILGLVPTPSKSATDDIALGRRTMMLNLLAPSATPARIGLLSAANTTAQLKWDGTDIRQAAATSVDTGPDDALSTASSPTIAGQVVSSGIATGTFYFDLPIQGDVWRIPIRLARMTMTVSADNIFAKNGTISGIIPTEELVTGIELVAGRISTQLCGGSTLDTIKQTIRQASDILVDGTQDPTKNCDAVSIGIGFEAVKVTVSGTAVDPPPSPDPCAD